MTEDEKYFVEKTLLKRVGEPIDIARAILFLASDKASYITGETIHVEDGCQGISGGYHWDELASHEEPDEPAVLAPSA